MSQQELYFLIEKYLKNIITEEESEILENLLKDKKNVSIFKALVQDDGIIKTEHKEINTEKAFAEIAPKLHKQDQIKTIKLKPFYKYAAVAVILLGLTFMFKTLTGDANNRISGNKVVEKQIKLILEDGTEHILTQTATDSIKTINNTVLGLVKNGTLSYLNSDSTKVTSFNTLKVPNGQRFKLALSDGSIVNLNSGSTLRYPTDFTMSDQRTVFLKGEAFFNVSKDASKRFIVKTETQNIAVLGTEFNVSAYENNENIRTTLQEGSVKVYNQKDTLLLVPNEQSSFNKMEQTIVKKIVNVSQFTGWMDDKKIFNDMSFANIAKQLERVYDITIINTNISLNKQRFTARFKDENIEQIMNYFKLSYEFKFKLNEKTLIIE